jgi:hypothetical protein
VLLNAILMLVFLKRLVTLRICGSDCESLCVLSWLRYSDKCNFFIKYISTYRNQERMKMPEKYSPSQ